MYIASLLTHMRACASGLPLATPASGGLGALHFGALRMHACMPAMARTVLLLHDDLTMGDLGTTFHTRAAGQLNKARVDKGGLTTVVTLNNQIIQCP